MHDLRFTLRPLAESPGLTAPAARPFAPSVDDIVIEFPFVRRNVPQT